MDKNKDIIERLIKQGYDIFTTQYVNHLLTMFNQARHAYPFPTATSTSNVNFGATIYSHNLPGHVPASHVRGNWSNLACFLNNRTPGFAETALDRITSNNTTPSLYSIQSSTTAQLTQANNTAITDEWVDGDRRDFWKLNQQRPSVLRRSFSDGGRTREAVMTVYEENTQESHGYHTQSVPLSSPGGPQMSQCNTEKPHTPLSSTEEPEISPITTLEPRLIPNNEEHQLSSPNTEEPHMSTVINKEPQVSLNNTEEPNISPPTRLNMSMTAEQPGMSPVDTHLPQPSPPNPKRPHVSISNTEHPRMSPMVTQLTEPNTVYSTIQRTGKRGTSVKLTSIGLGKYNGDKVIAAKTLTVTGSKTNGPKINGVRTKVLIRKKRRLSKTNNSANIQKKSPTIEHGVLKSPENLPVQKTRRIDQENTEESVPSKENVLEGEKGGDVETDDEPSRKSARNNDQVTKTRKYKFTCSFCQKGFNWFSHWLAHERVHTGERPFKCKHCPRKFKRADGLHCHQIIHTKAKTSQCHFCSKVFKKKESRERHLIEHTGIIPYACDYCETNIMETARIEEHLSKHKGKKRFTCQYCKQNSTNPRALVRHIRGHTGEKLFKCLLCNMTFSKKSALSVHHRVHSGARPYACTQCKKTFSIKGNLRRHLVIHSGQRPYQCHQCEKTYNNPSHLSRHNDRHH